MKGPSIPKVKVPKPIPPATPAQSPIGEGSTSVSPRLMLPPAVLTSSIGEAARANTQRRSLIGGSGV